MPFVDRFASFIAFVVLTLITLGIYPLYWVVTRVEEHREQMQAQKALLRQIRDDQRAIWKNEDTMGINA